MHDQASWPVRRSPRLRDYDYGQAGAYLVTVSVDDRTHRFGHVQHHRMHQNGAGQLVEEAWRRIPERFESVELDAYIVMPNHFHGVIFLGTDPDATAPALSTVLQAFKSITTIEYGRGVKSGMYPRYLRGLWHRSYHDRIIRNERVLGLARDYVADNPRKWQEAHDTEPERAETSSAAVR